MSNIRSREILPAFHTQEYDPTKQRQMVAILERRIGQLENDLIAGGGSGGGGGAVLPVGGDTGDRLVKTTGANFDTHWETNVDRSMQFFLGR